MNRSNHTRAATSPEPARPLLADDPLARFYARRGKRALDLVLCSVGLAVASPLLAALGAVVYLGSGRPVFFRQERVGLGGRVFRIFKFRSMEVGAVDRGRGYYLEEGDPRITGIGRWMRATSLDELPQLLNVMLGDMSLVGPRPNLTFIVERYRPHYDRILRVRPGLTSLVGISGRNTLRRSQMIALDNEYVATLSLRTDLRILLATVPAVLFRRGASDDVSEEFLEDMTPAEAAAARDGPPGNAGPDP